jgi:hypothetical protein
MRPQPPATIFDSPDQPLFTPAPDLIEWAVKTFIESGATLYNDDHRHLNFATLGALWTNVPNGRAGRRVIGQCEMGLPPLAKWGRARMERQLLDWFGAVPDFVLTFDAYYAAECGDAEFMALVEHELYHAAQANDPFGAPRFNKQTGRPIFTMRGHDVEEFIGVVRRYGAEAAGVKEMVDAANAGPEIARVSIAQACGTCRLRVA